MKACFLCLLLLLMLVSCQTDDFTAVLPGECEVHHVAMFKRSVPYAHGMIPMSKVEAAQGEWQQRMDHYPHPGDCHPATDIVMPGEHRKARIYVCPLCEKTMKQMKL